MKNTVMVMLLIVAGTGIISCSQTANTQQERHGNTMQTDDGRISLGLNPMQKQHQLMNMRSHLEAVQTITMLLSKDEYDEASEVAYTKLGSTTEMRLMCASFGNEEFENLGSDFHASADRMSEVFKKKDKEQSLEALSNTINYCVQCHATFRQ